MNKTQLVDCIQAKLGEDATKKCAEAALSAVLGAITDAVKGGASGVAEKTVLLENVGTEAVEGAAFEVDKLAAAFALQVEMLAAVTVANILIAGAAALCEEFLHDSLVNQLVKLTVYSGQTHLVARFCEMLGDVRRVNVSLAVLLEAGKNGLFLLCVICHENISP